MAYWYNIETRQVEDDDNRSPGENVMGPYETREEAANALEIARQKTEAWDEEDRRYEDEGFEDPQA
ncbi:methionine aminopeptidase [Actinomycetota bacterium]